MPQDVVVSNKARNQSNQPEHSQPLPQEIFSLPGSELLDHLDPLLLQLRRWELHTLLLAVHPYIGVHKKL